MTIEIEQASEARKNRLLTYAMGVSLVCLVLVMFYGFMQNRSYNDRLCAQQNDSREVLRNVLLLSRAQSVRTRYPAHFVRDDGERGTIVLTFTDIGDGNKRFYREALKLVRPIQC